jgi:hypothetical protein
MKLGFTAGDDSVVSSRSAHASPHFGEAAFDGKESNDMMMLGGKNRRT